MKCINDEDDERDYFAPEDDRVEIDEDRHGEADLSIDDHDEGQTSTTIYTSTETTSSDSVWLQQEESRKESHSLGAVKR